MTGESFEIRDIKPDARDFASAFLLAYRMDWLKGAIYFAVIFLLLFLTGPGESGQLVRALTALVGVGVVAGIVGVFMLVWIPFCARRTARDPLFAVPVTVRSMPGGFNVVSERGTYEYKWSDFVRYGQTGRVIVLKTRSRLVLVLPHRFFDQASLAAFTAAASAHIRR